MDLRSLDTAIISSYLDPQLYRNESKLRIINIDLQWSGTPLTLQLTKGKLVVEGRMKTLLLGKPLLPVNYSLSFPEADPESKVHFQGQ